MPLGSVTAGWRQDAAQAARSIVRQKSHSLAVVVGLSVGLIVSIATFSTLSSLMYGDRPGVRNREDLVQVSVSYTPPSLVGGLGDRLGYAPTLNDYALVRTAGPALGELAAEGDAAVAVSGRHETVAFRGAFVSGNYFDVLGTRPLAGRLLTPGDERANDTVAVVSDYFWRTHLDAAADALGAPILLGNRSFTVVGVTEPHFYGRQPLEPGSPESTGVQVWVPLGHARGWPGAPGPDDMLITAFGRVRDGFTADDARAQAPVQAARLSAASPATRADAALVIHAIGFGPNETPAEILLVLCAVLSVPLSVLLIGCANVANLQLSRATARARELAVRAALGASRAQLVRLLATETAALAIVAVAISALFTSAILRLAGAYLPFTPSLDWRVAVFSLTLMLGVTFLTGLAPAWLVVRRRGVASAALKQSAQAGGLGHSRLRAALVVGQVALSLIMLFGSGMMVRSARSMELDVPPALREQIVAEFNPDQIGRSAAEARRFAEDLRKRVETDPRVAGSALSREAGVRFRPADQEQAVDRFATGIGVTSSWFSLMDVPVIAGRRFTDADRADVAIVSARLAETVAPDGQAVGLVLRVGHDNDRPGRVVSIVGIVADHPTRPMAQGDRPDPVVYTPLGSEWSGPFTIRIRTTAVEAMRSDLRKIVRDLDAKVPWLDLRRGEDRYLEDANGIHIMAMAIGALGTLALTLSAAGLYAVMAYVVQLRRREIGVRIAIGAEPRRITRMVLRQSIGIVAVGVALGLSVAIPLGFGLRAVFVGTVSPLDPITVGTPVIALLTTAVLASAYPARRASRINPIQVLKED